MISLEDAIKQINLFSHIKENELQILKEISYITTRCEKDSILYYEADSMDKLLFLIDGQLKVYKVDKFDNEIFLYYVYPNTMISELSNLDDTKVRCFSNAEFIKDSTLLSIDFQKFKEHFLYQNPLVLKFIQELIYKNQQLQCIINRELVFDSTSKVAFMLINDLEMFNELKRTEVSLLLHIQPETLSRVLKRLVRNETITIEKGKVFINNDEELKAIYMGVWK